MLIFKLIYFVLLSLNQNGWVTLEKPIKPFAHFEESEEWVFFSKKIGEEKVLISFPKDPTYYHTKDNLEIVSSSVHAEHKLRVGPVADREAAEQIYFLDGFWFFEKLITTEHHTYFLQTKTSILDRTAHQRFVDSLDIQAS